jgi:hypothetical protein
LHHNLPRSYHYHAGTREQRSARPIVENSDKHAISGPVGSDQDSSGWAQGPLKSYIQDAEAEGDQELVEFFSAVLENNLEAAQRTKEMLIPRFQREQE